jgi:hypothetical protein
MSRKGKRTNIFISYRRTDSQDVTGRIFDHLVREYSRDSVFKDVDSIAPSQDFQHTIRQAILKADLALVVIGPDWLTARDKAGERRLEKPDDPVRMEIEEARRAGIPLIPIVVGNATMPEASQLPDSLRPLAFLHALSVRSDPDFRTDVTRLIAAIEKMTTQKSRHGAALTIAGLVLAAALMAIVVPFGLNQWSDRSRRGSSVQPNSTDQSNKQQSVPDGPSSSLKPTEPIARVDAASIPPGSPLPEGLSEGAPADSTRARSQVYFLDPDQLQIGWLSKRGPADKPAYTNAQLTVPARYTFNQGYRYRLKVTGIPGRPAAVLYPTIEVPPSTPKIAAYLANNTIPVQFTAKDMDQIFDEASFVTKIYELAAPEAPKRVLATAQLFFSTGADSSRALATAVSTGSDAEAEVDPVLEAKKRGTLLLVIRMGAIDLEWPWPEFPAK